MVNLVLRKKDPAMLAGKILNLNFPSNVTSMNTAMGTMTYGYSSGTYAKMNPMFNKISLVPKQEEIDSLGSGISKQDWERRFELVYRKALNQNVAAVMGVTPVILSFARYIVKKFGKKIRIYFRNNPAITETSETFFNTIIGNWEPKD